jgi:small redox-active disulfide protein 2
MVSIKVVGSGCPNCNKLEQLCREIVQEYNVPAQIEKVTNINEFANLGILLTPGLLINDQVVSSGKIPARSSLVQWITEAEK